MQLSASTLDEIDGIRHGFFTREGGVSGGIYASLNCGFGSKDRTEDVATNRGRVADALDLPHHSLLTVYQVHSPAVVTVAAEGWHHTNAPKADAMATRAPGVALGILAADCTPVLFADPDANVIGAAHAGWKGALDGVLEATLAAMQALGARTSHIRAAVGPCIAQISYEVGSEFRDRFVAVSADNDQFFAAGDRDAHHQFDLPGYVEARLAAAGINAIESLGRDTCSDETLFSYRRATHRRESDYGRNISVIALEPGS